MARGGAHRRRAARAAAAAEQAGRLGSTDEHAPADSPGAARSRGRHGHAAGRRDDSPSLAARARAVSGKSHRAPCALGAQELVQYANTLLKDRVLFGSDNPVIQPDRWLADFEKLPIKPEVRPLILKENAIRLLRLK
ncbi:MAG: amidohydrolase family protein [Pseudomonadota bacterium]